MSKGHTVPLIHLAHLIADRRLATFTFFTTPLNAPFIRKSLSSIKADVVELPFPRNTADIPPNVESTDGLSSMDQFLPFVDAVSQLQPHFEQALQALPTVSFIISDGFLTWTAESAEKFGLPRIVFYGMGNFSWTVQHVLDRDRPFEGLNGPENCVIVPDFPHIRLSTHDLCSPLDVAEPEGPFYEFIKASMEALKRSHGIIVNSFYELEAIYFDYWNKAIRPKAWCVGPLCLSKPKSNDRSAIIEWLDAKSAAGRPVIYVAFGTQAEVPEVQLQEIATGLELSGLDFLWVVRTKTADLGHGFESRVAERGKVVRDWVDQYEILQHANVKGFVSHCGWNSVLEAVCSGVRILAWPMMAEQHLNAKFVVDELRAGIRVRASDGSKFGLVKGEDLARFVKELMEGEGGEEMEERVRVLAGEGKRAVEGGGSSWRMIESMIDEASRK